jgi:hypothetical protein
MNDLFPVLEPPRGGLQRLRARMEQPRRARAAWLAVPALAVAVLLAVLVTLPTAPAPAQLTGSHPALAPLGPAVSGRAGTTVAQIPVQRSDVALYFVSSSPP